MRERRVVGNYGSGTSNFFRGKMKKRSLSDRKAALIKEINKVKGA